MLNFVENLVENERDPRSGPMNDQDHSLSLSDPDRSLVLSHFLRNFLQNLASCQTSFRAMITAIGKDQNAWTEKIPKVQFDINGILRTLIDCTFLNSSSKT
jgi:hypothetical protein